MTGLFLVRSPPARIEPLGFLGVAAAGRHDLALLHERIGDRYRLIEQSARIVAQGSRARVRACARYGVLVVGEEMKGSSQWPRGDVPKGIVSGRHSARANCQKVEVTLRRLRRWLLDAW